ncbi:hypothetical protein T11_717 [Trichinella zimbabwensis]|uniref:Uncharacterized protein n=1 Tax=Trichinella zimbabwensis TaxID=268475 RepID=A0A0V1GMX4_9BILA|nr:hypothetical protein T11_717 [Trichinella zimbabwensis]
MAVTARITWDIVCMYCLVEDEIFSFSMMSPKQGKLLIGRPFVDLGILALENYPCFTEQINLFKF